MDNTVQSLQQVRDFIARWNFDYPVDLWWRTKHKVPFGSKKHRKQTFVDMITEYEEEQLFKRLSNVAVTRVQNGKEVIEMTQEEIDEEYDSIDLKQYNDTK